MSCPPHTASCPHRNEYKAQLRASIDARKQRITPKWHTDHGTSSRPGRGDASLDESSDDDSAERPPAEHGRCPPGRSSTKPVRRSETTCLASPIRPLRIHSPHLLPWPRRHVIRAGSTQPSEFVFIWNATGRPAENSDGQRGSKVDVSLRTSESIFAVGVKERITLETNNSAPWQWRRICFTSKDDFGQRDPDTSDYFRRTSNGMVRLVRAQNEVTYLQDQLFEGQRNQDWLSMITAPVSTRHYSIKYDKTRVIKSQNNSGLTHNYKLWHPMRSNINTTANRPVRH